MTDEQIAQMEHADLGSLERSLLNELIRTREENMRLRVAMDRAAQHAHAVQRTNSEMQVRVESIRQQVDRWREWLTTMPEVD